MRLLWICMYAVAIIISWLGYTAGLTTPVNGTRKLQIGENSNPQGHGIAFDEIVVESNLQIRGKNPSSRSQRTQLFPVKTNSTKASENVKLAV